MEIQIRELTSKEAEPVYGKVSELFAEMYSFMNEMDLVLTLSPNGEKLWIQSIKASLGKLNKVYVAIIKDEIIGFAAGNIRLAPHYLGGRTLGYISHLYVQKEYRKLHVGHNLGLELISWFEQRNVAHVELEVLAQNAGALAFWNKLGFSIDNIRMHKKLSIERI